MTMKVLNRIGAAALATVLLVGLVAGPASARSWHGWTSERSDYWNHGGGSQNHGQTATRAWTSLPGKNIALQSRYVAHGRTIYLGPRSGGEYVSLTSERVGAHNPGY